MKLYDYAGAIHLHSSFSFNGHAPMEQIIHAAEIKEPVVCPDDTEGKNPQKYIDAVNNQGGFGFIAHPDHEGTAMFHVKHYCWNDWKNRNFIWEIVSNFRVMHNYRCLVLKIAHTRIIRNGLEWNQKTTNRFSMPVVKTGIYRVEVYLKSAG